MQNVQKTAILDTAAYESIWMLVKDTDPGIEMLIMPIDNHIPAYTVRINTAEFMNCQYETLSWCGYLYIPLCSAAWKTRIDIYSKDTHTILFSKCKFTTWETNYPTGSHMIKGVAWPNQTEWAESDRKIDPQIECIPAAVNAIIREYCQPYFIVNPNLVGMSCNGPRVITATRIYDF